MTTRVITQAEAAALLKFRERIADVLPTFTEYQKHDIWLLKWLRDKELNIDRAEKMLRKTLKWRKEEEIDEILSWSAPEYIVKGCPIQVPGVDKDGRIISLVHFGKWPVKKIIAKGDRQNLVRYAQQMVEVGMRYLEKATTPDRYLSRFNIVYDFEGFSLVQYMSRETIDVLLELLRIYKAHYPESLHTGWVLNAPKYFDLFWKLIKPVMTSRTLARFHIHGYEGYREEIMQLFVPDDFPSQLGGANTTLRLYRVEYLFDIFNKNEIFPADEMAYIVLPAGEKYKLEYNMAEGDKLSWNFRTDDYGIGYSVEFRAEDRKDFETLFSADKADAHLYLQKGAVVADKPGTYTLLLDNSQSRMRSKNVYFAIRHDPSSTPDELSD